MNKVMGVLTPMLVFMRFPLRVYIRNIVSASIFVNRECFNAYMYISSLM